MSAVLPSPPRFPEILARHGLELRRGETRTLQVNVGYRCDLSCRHCHLTAGPQRQEMMSRATMGEVIAYARRGAFQVADVTGGAPELVPDLDYLLTGLAQAVPRVMLRTNLTALDEAGRVPLLELCRQLRITLVASFPAVNAAQLEAQRGAGVWSRSVAQLSAAFNPQAVPGLMCRSQLSIAWDGSLYDCDFNQAAELPLGGKRRHVSELAGPPEAGSPIATGAHCFACTAGAGFTCGGEIAA